MMMSCVLVFVFFIVITTHSSNSSGWYLDLRYRVELTVPTDGSPLHTEEQFVLDTSTLFSDAKLRSDCSDLVFLLTDDTETEDALPLGWWAESPCPSFSPDHPYTTFWINIPTTYDASSNSIYVMYGSNETILAPSNLGRLNWALGTREIHFFEDSCPAPFDSIPAWDELYLTGIDNIPSCCIPRNVGGHHHTIRNVDVTLTTTTSGTLSVNDACGDETANLGTMVLHGHIDDGLATFDTDVESLALDSFALNPCYDPTPMLYTRSDVVPPGTATYVGLFMSPGSLPGAVWAHYDDSTDRFVRLVDGVGGLLVGGTHVHSNTAYVSASFDFLVDDPVEDIDASVSDPPAYAVSHTHTIGSFAPTLDSVPTVVEPSNDRVHFYAATDPAFYVGDGLNSASFTSSQIHVFENHIPPLGYRLIPEAHRKLLKGFGDDGPSLVLDSFSQPFVASPPHHHEVETWSTSVGGADEVIPDEDLGSCSMYSWGPTFQGGTVHSHLCRGVTQNSGRADDLPSYIPLLLAYRLDDSVSSRPVQVGPEGEEAWSDGTDPEPEPDPEPDPEPTEEFWEKYGLFVYAGAGGAVGLVAVIVVIIVALCICVCCFCSGRKRNSNVSAEMTPSPGGGDRLSRAKLQVKEELFSIQTKEIELLERIGQGGGGATVFRGKWAGRTIAVKIFQINVFDEQQASEFEKELTLASSLKHPNIVTFFGCGVDDRLMIVMEYCSNGNLSAYLRISVEEGHPVELDRKLKILLQIACGMSYLHGKGIVHRDLKPENVLLDEQLFAKIMDFGISRMISSTSKMTSRIGTPGYMAPEIVLGDDYDLRVDSFSFGILLFEVLSGDFHPYGIDVELKGNLEFKVANNPDYRPDLTKTDFSPRIQDLAKSCWSHSPDSRPSFDDIVAILEKDTELE